MNLQHLCGSIYRVYLAPSCKVLEISRVLSGNTRLFIDVGVWKSVILVFVLRRSYMEYLNGHDSDQCCND